MLCSERQKMNADGFLVYHIVVVSLVCKLISLLKTLYMVQLTYSLINIFFT
jgi:hypothetical protein